MQALILSISIISAIVLSRTIPHVSNFTPVLAIVLCAAFLYKRSSIAAISVMIGLAISDAWIGLYDYSLIFVYLGYGAIFASGFSARRVRDRMNSYHVIGGSLLAAIVFFIVSNFGVWLHSGMYPPTLEGLIDCYIMGIPFFRNTMMSTMLYSGLFYTIWKFVAKPVRKPAKQKAKS